MIKTRLQLRRFSQEYKLLEARSQMGRSWLKHLFDLLYVHLYFGQDLAGVNDISSVARTLDSHPSQFGHLQVGSPGGGMYTGYTTYVNNPRITNPDSQNVGIVVGTSNVPVTPIQDALQAKIAHGEGADQLLYGGCELCGLTFADPNGQFVIRRYFSNVLGGAITVQEVGIYSLSLITADEYSAYSFCIARDVVAPGITVNNGEILEATYTPQITV